MIVLIDVSLSHLFCLPPPPYSLFAILSVNFLAYAHPLHECSKYRKGVDHFDLYLASGLGMSRDQIQKKTKCETLVDLVLNNKNYVLLSYIPIPFLACKHHFETFESRIARALAPLCSYVASFNTRYRILPVMT